MVDGGGEGVEDGDLGFGRRVAGRDGESDGEAVEEDEAFGEFDERD